MAIPTEPFLIAASVFLLAGVLLVVASGWALSRRRPILFVFGILAGALLAVLGLLAGTVALGIRGYRALTHEETAARITVRPAGPQRFEATFRFPDGRETAFEILGDQIYVDAQILKWKPLANLLGLHTAYALDRAGGRYRDILQERSGPRTVHLLAEERTVDLFSLRLRHGLLAPLLDAEYGSATYVPVTGPAELELRVSTTGLLLRPAVR